MQEMQHAVPIKLMSHSLRWTFFEFIQENIQLFQICNLVNECVPHPQESTVDGEPGCSVMHYRAAAKTKKKKKKLVLVLCNERQIDRMNTSSWLSHQLWNSLKLALNSAENLSLTLKQESHF